MIIQDFYIPQYDWHIRVYYAVTTYWTDDIILDLRRIGCAGNTLRRAYENLERGDLNTGLTYSNNGESVMVISKTSTPAQFLNSWMHELRHLSRHIEQSCGISPYGEEAAYLAGDIAQRMFPIAQEFICQHCREGLYKKFQHKFSRGF